MTTSPRTVLLRKEAKEFVRTWRVWVLCGFVLFFAVTSPLLAKLTPDLVNSLVAGQPGVSIKLPDPTWRDSYAQWIKNLSQIGMLVVLIVGAGMVAGERASGTAVLVLTKPVSRSWFVSAKALALSLSVLVTVALGTVVVQVGTLVAFGAAPADVLWESGALWFVSALVLIAMMTLLSTALSTLAAAGCGIGVYLVVSALTMLRPVAQYSFVGLFSAPSALAAGDAPPLVWPLVTAVAAVVVLVGAAALVFRRAEL
ncbi:MAG: ABC transporter permease [Actinomycetes bacterium]